MENKCKTISFVNQKGGVAKTSSATIMAYILAKDYNKKVCLIDFDGQANASKTMGIEEELNKDLKENEDPILLQDIEWTIADIMNKIIQDEEISDEELEKYIYHLKGVDLIPANIELAMLENNLVMVDFQREYILKKLIDRLRNRYDYIIVDSLPKLGTQMINVLVASDEIIIPTNPAKKSIDGFHDLLMTVQKVKRNANENLKVAGILITMANEGTSAFNYLKGEIEKVFKDYYVFNTIIPYVKKWEEGDIFGKLWVEHEPKHKASKRYIEFVKEYMSKGE